MSSLENKEHVSTSGLKISINFIVNTPQSSVSKKKTWRKQITTKGRYLKTSNLKSKRNRKKIYAV
jgi:hypothetical protein